MTCPNKNDEDWKKLAKTFGPSRAEAAFRRNGFKIPKIDEAEQLLGIHRDTPWPEQKKYQDWLTQDKIQDKTFGQKFKIGLNNIKSSVVKLGKSAVQSISPRAFEEKNNATNAEIVLRKNYGKKYMKDVADDKAAEEVMRWWNKQTYNERMRFMDVMENPKMYDLTDEPAIAQMAKAYADRMDAVYETIKKIKDIPYFQDYFPHFWKDPQKATEVFSKIGGKNPMEGSKSFLRQRFYQDIKAGMDAGLELVTTNPEEMVRIAEVNATKFKMAHDIFNDFKDAGMLSYHGLNDKSIPEGWELVNDALFKRMSPFAVKEGGVPTGEAGLNVGGWYMPADAARIVNNSLSRGLSEVPGLRHAHEFARSLNNLKNTFQLGLSFFHYTTTSIDAAVTSTSSGLSLFLSGNPRNMAEGLRLMAEGLTIVPAVVRNYRLGSKAIKDSYAGNVTSDVQSLMDVNARVASEKQWSINSAYKLRKAIDNIKLGENLGTAIPKTVWNSILLIPEILAKPIMEYHVPRMKVAGFLKTVEIELKLNPNATALEIQKIKQKAWDSMDDRLGQVVYDNVFWNKSLKDLSFMTIRSFGWTGGTIKAIGKGFAEAPGSIPRALKGKGLSPRSAWLLTLPFQVGLYGGLLNYLLSGEMPEGKDYYFPKDGTTNPDGTPGRISLPTYMKDIFGYKQDPLKTLKGKKSPFISEVIELYNNEDFYGTNIRDEEDPFFKQGLDLFKYEAKSFVPFGFRPKPGPEEPLTSKKSLLGYVGLTQAPSEFVRTDLENKINDRLIKEMQYAKKKPGYDPNQSAFKKLIAEQVRQGKSLREMSLEEKKKAGLVDDQGRYLHPKGVSEFVQRSKLNNPERMFKYLSAEGQLNIIANAKKDEIELLLKNRSVKKQVLNFVNLKRTNPEIFVKHPEYIQAYETLTNKKFAQDPVKENDVLVDGEE